MLMNSHFKIEQQQTLMTVERLNQYYFNDQRVPFWNYDPDRLTFGVEVEYFIAHIGSDGGFKLANKDDFTNVIKTLESNFSYSSHRFASSPGRISKDTESGFIAIKPDFTWHILEVVLPPRHLITAIKELLTKTLAEVDMALATHGLRRLDRSCLPQVPDEACLVQLDRLSGHLNLISQHKSKSIYKQPLFPAIIAATHVHANILCPEIFEKLPEFYAYEPMARSRFNRMQDFCGVLATDHRSHFYRESLGSDYKLRDIPESIPASIEDYCAMYNESPQMFPNDPFFPVRDLSCVRPTKYGTVEFRSACSFLEVEKIIEIVEFRKQCILAILPHTREKTSKNPPLTRGF